jgi:sugar-specific transcriptional regulator TrmB
MAWEKKTVKFLEEEGFTQPQIDIFLFLNRNGPQKASDIAAGIGMYRMQVYRHLDELEKLGIVSLTFESPKRFSVISIEELLNRKTAQLNARINSIERGKGEMVEELRNPSQHVLTQIDQFAIVQGSEMIGNLVLDLIKRAKKEVCCCNTLERYTIAYSSGIHEAVTSRKGKFREKCLIQTISEEAAKINPFIKSFSRSKNTELRQIGNIIAPFPCFAIKDGEEAVLITTPQKTSDQPNKQELESMSGLLTNNATIVGLIQKLFEDLWKESTDVKIDN